MKPKIVVLDGHILNSDANWSRLETIGDVTYYDFFRDEAAENIIKALGDAEFAITNKVPMTKEIMDSSKLKYIGVLSTGYDVVDIVHARKKGITVTNGPSYGTHAVAQHAIALLLEIAVQAGKHIDSVIAGDWCKSRYFCYWLNPFIELAHKNMGIIGMGEIGKTVAKIADAMGMRVISPDSSSTRLDNVTYLPFDEFLKEADVISLHCPLTEKTEKIINETTIAKMKKGAIIINTSRGQLVCDQAVINALDSEHVFAYATDVVVPEPPDDTNPLLIAARAGKRCLITPHVAWAPVETRQRLVDMTFDNITAYLNGSPRNVVS